MSQVDGQLPTPLSLSLRSVYVGVRFGLGFWDLSLGIAMELTFGARLRAQRERQQVDLAAIADETKINAALLEGLERDDVSRWPGGLFRRAYIRTYAQKIGLDPEQVLREFIERHPDRIEEAAPVEAIAEANGGKRPKTRLGLMIAGLAGLRPQKPLVTRTVAPPEVTVDQFAEQIPVEQAAAEPVTAAESFVAEPVTEPRLVLEPEEAPRSARLLKVTSIDPPTESRPTRAMEHGVWSTARLCTRIACARDDRDLSAALEELAAILDAQGVILWVWDAERAGLCAALAYGYPDDVLTRLPNVARSNDNAIAAAFRFGQTRVVRGNGRDTGAFVAPLLATDGCVGVLALEFANGGEQSDFAQALTTIVSAQFATLCAATPQADIADPWHRRDHSLVAS